MKEAIAKVTTTFGEENRSVCFSDCDRYRYYLKIVWGGGGGRLVNFIGLNPSTATETVDDPTIRRCKSFARDFGYTGIVMTNLFAFRATDPLIMKVAADPVGPMNDHYIEWAARICCTVIGAWGGHGDVQNRQQSVAQIIFRGSKNIQCLGLTANFQPRHPLYLSKKTSLHIWGIAGGLK